MNNTNLSQRSAIRHHPLYDSGVAKVSAFAAAMLVVSIILTGVIAYWITKEQSVKKLKENDLVYIGDSIVAKINGSIEKALEMSQVLEGDREVQKWILQGEPNGPDGDAVIDKIVALKERFRYDNGFIISVPTGNYYAENGSRIDTMSRSDPDDSWYFTFLQNGVQSEVTIDYNEERRDTSVFVNALMKSGGSPLAIVGVGFSLRDMSAKFAEYRYGKNGSLWLTDRSGTIYLSDEVDQNGKNIREFMPDEASAQVIDKLDRDREVLDYRGTNGKINDLILLRVPSTEWTLVVSVDRDEAVSFLQTIQAQTAVAVAIALFSVVFFFYYTSRKLADPYKRAILLNGELEKQIAIRTAELAEQNGKMRDSLDYASRIQLSALPTEAELSGALPAHFVWWRPKDVVGGDFYWIRRVKEGLLVAVGDCTGHGVPGALMSIMTVSLLNQIVERNDTNEPSLLLGLLNRSIKQTLNQSGKDGLTDDGLDIGLCLLMPGKVAYAGARCALYVRSAQGLAEIEGSRTSAGYRKTPDDYVFAGRLATIGPEDTLYMTTDGLTDQNGGEKNYSFGKSRWKQWLEANGSLPLEEQRQRLETELAGYRGTEPQRDDITVLGFRLPKNPV